MPLESRLLLACAKVYTTQGDEAGIRQMLDGGIDWTLFAHKAIDQGLASLAGHTLARVAPDLVPDDILEALRMIIDQTQARNRVLFDELARMIEATPVEGPILAIHSACGCGARAGRQSKRRGSLAQSRPRPVRLQSTQGARKRLLRPRGCAGPGQCGELARVGSGLRLSGGGSASSCSMRGYPGLARQG